jgi:ribonuclease BN (tRNA processing enzyme)
MRLTVLGTAAPYPRPDNACSGYLVQSGEGVAALSGKGGAAHAGNSTTIWVDAGSGTLAELQRHTELAELDAIWVSHRHADHSADLLVAYYALRFADLTPAHPIPLIAPEGTIDRLAAFLGPGSVAELPRVFDFRPMSGFGEAGFGSLALEWGPVQHGVPAFGLMVKEGSRRLAYSGDSAPCISLEELADHADTLLIEAGYDLVPSSDDAPAHHSPEDAGRTAAAAQVSRLVLTHVAGTVTAEAAAARASAHFDGEIVVARPGDVLTI